jgi:hypothetical protein
MRVEFTPKEAEAILLLIGDAVYRNAATGEPDELRDHYRDRLADTRAAGVKTALGALKKLDAALKVVIDKG